MWDWDFFARPEQKMPAGTWGTWVVMAGRGWGKTKVGAETTRAFVEREVYWRMALVAPTAADARDVMVEGPSGILACSPDNFRPAYQPSKRLLTWPNGAVAHTYSADEPDRLRGPQHDFAWCDELSVWTRGQETWDMLQFGLRIGKNPRSIVTMTPRPTDLVRELVRDAGTHLTHGSTFENEENVAQKFIDKIRRKYEGTRLGRQELYAELLDDVPGALWTRAMIDDHRRPGHPDLVSVVVAVDPSVTNTEESDECGLIAAGLGDDGDGYVFWDGSGKMSPNEWAQRAVGAYRKFNADCIVAESNNGGELVRQVILTVDPRAKVKLVHASKGKYARAEPVAALYEQGLIHHVSPDRESIVAFDILEEQMCTFVPKLLQKSPDRLDALVWALSELFLEESETLVVYSNRIEISPF